MEEKKYSLEEMVFLGLFALVFGAVVLGGILWSVLFGLMKLY